MGSREAIHLFRVLQISLIMVEMPVEIITRRVLVCYTIPQRKLEEFELLGVVAFVAALLGLLLLHADTRYPPCAPIVRAHLEMMTIFANHVLSTSTL